MLCWLSIILVLAGGDRHGITCIAAQDHLIAAGGHGGVDLIPRRAAVSPAEPFREGEAPAEPFLNATLGERHNTFALAFAGELLLDAGGTAGETAELRCWKWRSRELVWKVEEEGDIFYSLAQSGSAVFAGGGDKSISLFDPKSGRRQGSLSGHAGAVLALAVSPGGKHLASGGADRSLRLWDAGTGELLRTIHNHSGAVHALAWSPDGKYLASGSADRSVRLWEPLSGRLVRIIRGHEGAVLALAFTEKHLVSGASDGKVRLIDPSSAALETVLDAHQDWVTGVAVAGSEILSADWAGRIFLWREGAARPVALVASR